MDVIQDIEEIRRGFIHNQPVVVRKMNYEGQEYYATVLNPTADYLLISALLDKEGNSVSIREGERIELASKIRGFLWGGLAIVVEILRDDFEGIWLTYPKKLMRVQRRSFLRVNMTFPITVNIFREGILVQQIKGYCHDLSGSGISIKIPEIFLFDDETEVNISFSYKDLAVNASIEPIHHIRQGEFFKVGCKFKGIDVEFSERVHKFVVKEQLMMRKEGLI